MCPGGSKSVVKSSNRNSGLGKTNMAARAANVSKTNNKKIIPRKTTKQVIRLPAVPKVTINTGESPCSKCEKDNLNNMLQCHLCKLWYHALCLNIHLEQLKNIIKVKEHLPFQCSNCYVLLTTQWDSFMKDITKTFNDKIDNCVNKCNEIAEKSNAVGSLTSGIIDQISKFDERLLYTEQFNKTLPKVVCDLVNDNIEKASKDIKVDVFDKLKRKNRIVLFGMSNNSGDTDAVKNLANDLGINSINVKKTFRVNPNNNSTIFPLPLNVEFRCVEEKYRFLNKTVREKLGNLPTNSPFYGVSIVPDRSFKERQLYRTLRQEMNLRNANLESSGVFDTKWIIEKMSLVEVEVNPDD